MKDCIRTCVICRKKFEQKTLNRFKCEDKKLVLYNNYGRSFYICNDCVNLLQSSDIKQKDYKRIEKALMRECKNKDDYVEQLKEILVDVR